MTKATFIRLSGWALMLGAVTFSMGVIALTMGAWRYVQLGLPAAFRDWGLFAGLFLLAMGMLGLRAR